MGQVEGDPASQFFQVYAMAEDADGSIYVGDSQTATVRRFSSTGEFVGQFGGRGQGPGEFTMINALWTHGDSVMVLDWQRGGRLGVFTSAGDLVESWSFRGRAGSQISPVWFSPVLGWLGFNRSGALPSAGPGDSIVQRDDLRVLFPGSDSAGAVVYELPPRILYRSTTTHGLDWGLFLSRRSFGFDGEGNLYVTIPREHRVDKFDAAGPLVRSVRAAYEPQPIAATDVENVLELAVQVIDTSSRIPPNSKAGQRRSIRNRIEEQASYPIPTTRAPLGEIVVAPDGSYWLERADHHDPARREVIQMFGNFAPMRPGPSRWEVVSSEGERLHTVELPARFVPMTATTSTITGVLYDDLDVEYVVRYTIASTF